MAAEQILLDDSFYVSIKDSKDGTQKVVICEYEKQKYDCDDLPSTSLSININDINQMKEFCQKIEDDVLPFIKHNLVQRKRRNEDEGEGEKLNKKSKEEDKKNDVRSKGFMAKKPAHLKLKIPPIRNIICDEVEMTEREITLEDKLFHIYVEEAWKELDKLRTENCYGCIHNRPSQKDHDLCLEFLHSYDADNYMDRALSKVDGTKIVHSFHEVINEINPPLNGLELLKYKTFEWAEETAECHYGQNIIKTLLSQKLYE